MTQPTRSQLKKNLQALRERLERKPEDLDARMRMARTHRLLGEKRQAVAHYRSVARYLSLSGRPLDAISVLKELLQLDPMHEETLLFLAKLYARTHTAEGPGRAGRVAVPVVSDDTGPIALPEGLPSTASGLWQAIRPQSTDVFQVVHSMDVMEAEELEPSSGVSIAAELAELDEAYTLDEVEVLEERPLTEGDPDEGTFRDDSAAGGGEANRSPELGEGFDVIGPLTTEDVVLPQVPLFSSLPVAAFVELGHAMVFQKARPGDLVFEEGEPGDSCIVISRGEAVAFHRAANGEEVELMRLRDGDFAGVHALAESTAETRPRQAALRAETHLEFYEIDRLALAELVDRHPEVAKALAEFYAERLVLNLLAWMPLFGSVDADTRRSLAADFVERRPDAGAELFYEGYEHDGLWVVVSGGVRVLNAAGDEVRSLASGEVVGCLAGTLDAETGHSAVAGPDTVLAQLKHKNLEKHLGSRADLEESLTTMQSEGWMLDKVCFAFVRVH